MRAKYQHDCRPPIIPEFRLRAGISSIDRRWRCPTCGQLWRIRSHVSDGWGNGGEAERLPVANPWYRFKHWLWRRTVRPLNG